MKYVDEEISVEDQLKIVGDAGNSLGHLYLARGGYFQNFPGLRWVVDRSQNSYLLAAPYLLARRQSFGFHFFFNGAMYAVEVNGTARSAINILTPPPSKDFAAFTEAIEAAFDAHGLTGQPDPVYRFRVPAKEE